MAETEDADPEGKTIIAETADAGRAEEGDKKFGNKSLWKRCRKGAESSETQPPQGGPFPRAEEQKIL